MGFEGVDNESPARADLTVDGTPEILCIDQGPIVLMAENCPSGLIWELMRDDPCIVRGLCRVGFTGG